MKTIEIILKYGKNIRFSSNSYKPKTDLVDGSYSLLVQHYVVWHEGTIIKDFTTPADVIVRVHETDKIECNHNTIIFDPWRTYPQADNVVYYGR